MVFRHDKGCRPLPRISWGNFPVQNESVTVGLCKFICQVGVGLATDKWMAVSLYSVHLGAVPKRPKGEVCKTSIRGFKSHPRLQRFVIVEGVETLEQLAFLQAHGCDEGQGYYFSRPVVAQQFAKLLETGISATVWN